MISILLLSWNRYDELERTLGHNLGGCGAERELLVCDQGSSDPRVFDEISRYAPTYFRRNSKNEGIAKSFNQLYLRSKGDVIALMSNDIIWPGCWGAAANYWHHRVKAKIGITSIDWGHSGTPPMSMKNGVYGHWLTPQLNRCFGPTILSRKLIEHVGLFHEGFNEYGLDDSDLNERVTRAGYESLYMPGLKAEHIGHDVGQDSDYRRMKDASMAKNLEIFSKRVAQFDADPMSIYEPLPPMRDPI